MFHYRDSGCQNYPKKHAEMGVPVLNWPEACMHARSNADSAYWYQLPVILLVPLFIVGSWP